MGFNSWLLRITADREDYTSIRSKLAGRLSFIFVKSGITLIEIIIVIIILGVLATLGLTQYGGVRERALDREAQANLRLIIAAARIYRMEYGDYYAAGNTADINDNYRLFLPTPANPTWNYSTSTTIDFCAQADRNVPGGRNWFLEVTDVDGDPDSGTCP